MESQSPAESGLLVVGSIGLLHQTFWRDSGLLIADSCSMTLIVDHRPCQCHHTPDIDNVDVQRPYYCNQIVALQTMFLVRMPVEHTCRKQLV